MLANIKKERLDESAVRDAAIFFDQLPQDRVATLANGFFGLYTDPDRSPVVADNVRMLWPKLWDFVSVDTRRNYGLRHARARASAETGVATAARELIDLVDGAAYLTEEVRAVEIAQALDDLMAAHDGMNNFYTEAAPAKRLAQLVGDQGKIPAAVSTPYIRNVVQVYLGNGYGVPWAAVPTYTELLQKFDGAAASLALRLFLDPINASLLWTSTGRSQWDKLLDLLEPKLTRTTDRNLLAEIRAFTGTPDQLRLDSKIKKLATAGP